LTYLRVLLSLIILAGFTAIANGQQACKLEMSVGVINSNGESFRGLAPEDFLAHGPKGVGVKSVTYDDGPRRLLMVLDTNKKLPAGTHKAELELVKSIVAASRPEDSLALIIARGPGGQVKFGEDRSGLLDALDSNSNTGTARGVLDAVLEGIEWFSDSRPGDAIVMITASTEGNHKTNARSLARALAGHHIRLFGLALGPIMTRNPTKEGVVTSTTSQGMAYATAGVGDLVYDTGDQDFYPLTMNSGGVVVAVMNDKSQQGGDRWGDPRFQQFLKSRALIISNAVHAFYRVEINQPRSSHPEDWSLEIKESIRKLSPAMFVLYDHELGPCS
jgi:hypothetical protein